MKSDAKRIILFQREETYMQTPRLQKLVLVLILLISWMPFAAASGQSPDPLPSWRDTARKQAIIAFVKAVSTEGRPDFVPEEYRIATFDMDGTILIEKPVPINFEFARHYLNVLGDRSPSLQAIQPYKAVRENDSSYIDSNALQILTTAYMGYTHTEFRKSVLEFVTTQRHPRYDKPYIDLFYTPMLELISYLKVNNFRVYVISGSTQEFIRSIVRHKTGIENSNLIGTQVSMTYQSDKGIAAFSRNGVYRDLGAAGPGKPLIIEYQIGEIPVLAFGNSAGDQQMFEYAATNRYRNLVLCLEHDDTAREYVYESAVSYKPGWLRVSMKDDFAVVFGKK